MQFSSQFTGLSQKFLQLPQQKLAQGISAVILCYIAYLAAQLTWLWVPKELVEMSPITAKHSVAVEQGNNRVNLSALTALNVFGHYSDEPKVVESVQVQDAPETKLNLTLSGVVASDDNDVAAAVIENNNKQETYGVGETINGTRAILESVFNDRVLIKLSGRLETLMLDGFDYKKNTGSVDKRAKVKSSRAKTSNFARTPDVLDLRDNQDARENAKSLKRTLTNEPSKITDYLRISPKRQQGRIVGYTLRPGKNAEFFKSSGLKNGDVATQMNGYDLTVPQDAARALQALKQEQEVSLLLDRNGEMTEILFSIRE